MKRFLAILTICFMVVMTIPTVVFASTIDEGLMFTGPFMEYDENIFNRLEIAYMNLTGKSLGTFKTARVCYYSTTTSDPVEMAKPNRQYICYRIFIIPEGYDYSDFVMGMCLENGTDYFCYASVPVMDYLEVYWNASNDNDYIENKLDPDNLKIKNGSFNHQTFEGEEFYFRQNGGWASDKIYNFLYSDLDLVGLPYDPQIPDRTPIFDYLKNGNRDNVVLQGEAFAPSYTYDSTLGFSTGAFTVRRLFDETTWGCHNLKIDFAPTSYTLDYMTKSTKQWYLDLTITMNSQMQWYSKTFTNFEGSNVNETAQYVIRIPIDNISLNSCIVNITALVSQGPLLQKILKTSGMADKYQENRNFQILEQKGNNKFLHTVVNGYFNYYDQGVMRTKFGNLLDGTDSTGIGIVDDVVNASKQVLDELLVELGLRAPADNYEYKFSNFDVEVSGRITDGSVRSNPGYAYLNLLDGTNSGFTCEVDEAGNEGEPQGEHSDKNDYKADGNGDYYYYDYSNNTTNNITTPSANFDNMSIQHMFLNTLSLHLDNAADLAPTNNIYVYPSSSGGSGGSGGVSSDPVGSDETLIIEDDDYTRETVMDYMKYGFEILDNSDTDEGKDGLLAAAASATEGLPFDLKEMMGFGIASIISINIIRSFLRR